MNGLADKLLGSEALALLQAAQLNPDELALVSDMVAQLACHAAASPAQHQQQQVPGHAGLAAQLEQLLPSLMHRQQQQQQQQHVSSQGSLVLQHLAAAAPAVAQPVHAPAWRPAPVATRSHPAAPTANVTGLHSPSSSSSGSGCSSPASPRSWAPGRAHAAASDHNQQQHSAVQQRSVPRGAAGRPDAGAQAAAEVLSAALADPTASVEDVVGLFDTMLSVSGSEARVLQQMLVGEELGLELAAAAPPQAAAPASSWSGAAPAYLCKQQQEKAAAPGGGGRQPGHQQLVAASSMGAWQACGGQLNQAQRSLAVSKLESAASAGSARSGPASRLNISTARTMDVQANQQQHQQQQWQPVAATASGSRGRASSVPHASSSRLLAGGTPRSHSPTASSPRKTAASAAEAAAAERAARSRSRSCSPLEVEREWLAGLRDASPQRSRSPGRSRSASPPGAARRQQHCAWQSAVAAQYWDAAAALQDSGGGGQRALPPWDSSTRPHRRTSDDDDGGDDAWPQDSRQPGRSGSSSRRHRMPEPVRLPQDELEERARRFYERNMDWKRRCGLVYERQKHAEEAEATQDCTFSPVINRRSEKMVQEAGLKYPMRPIRPLTALADRGWQQARQQQARQQQQRRPASTGRIRPPQQAAQQHGHPFSSRSASPCSYTTGQHATPSAAQRLYQDAAVRQSRAAQYRAVTSKAEKQARAWSAPRSRVNEGVSSRLYEHLDPDAASASARRHAAAAAATVVEGCSFQPWTNPRGAGPAGSRRSASAQRSSSSRPAAGGDVVCPEAAAGPSPQQLQDEFVAAFDELVSNSPRQQQPQQQDVDTSSEAPEQQQQQQQAGAPPDSSSSPRQQRIGSLSRNTDLDWQEFITRQQRFVSTRDAKVAAVASSRACGRTSPELSPGTKRILAEQRLLYSATGGSPRSPGAAAATRSADGFLGRLEQQTRRTQLLGASASPGSPGSVCSAARPGSFRRQQQQQQQGGVHLPEGCTFKPAITPRAAALKGRSLEELSEGDRLRREVRLEQQRVVAEARSLDGHTFTPDLSPSRQRGSREWLNVPPRLRLTDEGLTAYMASLEEQRRQLGARRAAAAKREQELQRSQCTFKPTTTPVPAYVSELVDVGRTARYVDKALQQQSQQLSPAGASAKAIQPAADATRTSSAAARSSRGIGSCPAGAVVTAVAPAWLSKKY